MPASIELQVMDEFFTNAAAVKTRDELNATLINAMRKLGFDRINVSTMRDVDLPASQQKFALTCDYPEDWLQHYMKQGYLNIDPVAQNARSGVNPFFWNDLIVGGTLEPEQIHFLGEAREAGLHNGIGLPFLGAPGLRGGIALATSQPYMEHSKSLDILWGMTSFYYLHFKKFTREEFPLLPLPPRESEVAALVFAGKTNQQIARSLGSSRHTVNMQVRQIFKKFGVHTRVQALHYAITYGLYDPYSSHD